MAEHDDQAVPQQQAEPSAGDQSHESAEPTGASEAHGSPGSSTEAAVDAPEPSGDTAVDQALDRAENAQGDLDERIAAAHEAHRALTQRLTSPGSS